MIVKYFDANGVALPSPLPNPFSTASQTITVRIENPQYTVCFEETTVEFFSKRKTSSTITEKSNYLYDEFSFRGYLSRKPKH